MKFRTFSDAKTFVHSRSLKNRKEWKEYCKSGKKPNDIPWSPSRSYKNEGWQGWGDWLGTYNIAKMNMKFRPFNEARDYARSLNLPGKEYWFDYLKNNKLPSNIPTDPSRSYKDKGWISWGDWLGTNTIAHQNRKFRPFNEG